MNYADVAQDAERRLPPSTLEVPPSTFAITWKLAPKDVEVCGLRPLSEADQRYARAEAARVAFADHPHGADLVSRIDAFNDTCMRLMVARGTCDPNNAHAGWEVWGGSPEDAVLEALTREGCKFLFDALERVTLATSPVRRPISDDELSKLLRVAPVMLARMPAARSARARRLLSFLLSECEAFEREGD